MSINGQQWSPTLDGREINLFNLDPAIITVDHIAKVLARINRWAGHWKRPVSVARHCLSLTAWLEKSGYSNMILLQSMFHDAAEAYTTDIPSPLKKLLWIGDSEYTSGHSAACAVECSEMVSYARFEERLLGHIFKHLNIGWPIDPVVMQADRDIRDSELLIIRGDQEDHLSIDPCVVAEAFKKKAWSLFGNEDCLR